MAKSEFSAKADGIKAALAAIPKGKEHAPARKAVQKVLSDHRSTKIQELKTRVNKLDKKKSK